VFKYSFQPTNKRLLFTDVASRYGYMAPVMEEKEGNTEREGGGGNILGANPVPGAHSLPQIPYALVWELNPVLRGDRPSNNPWRGTYSTPGVTPGIIILSNFMSFLHRVNKFGGGGKAREGGCCVCSFFCQPPSCPEPVNEFPFDFEILRHVSRENLIYGCRRSAKRVLYRISN